MNNLGSYIKNLDRQKQCAESFQHINSDFIKTVLCNSRYFSCGIGLNCEFSMVSVLVVRS